VRAGPAWAVAADAGLLAAVAAVQGVVDADYLSREP
jgi:hypothetical protein